MRKIIAVLLIGIMAALVLTACGGRTEAADSGAAETEPGADSPLDTQPDASAAPSSEPTEEPARTSGPTEEPTPEPTPSFAYDEHDFSVLRAFFEQKDESGAANGAKCFPAYDPDDPATWAYTDAESDCSILWDGAGRARSIILRRNTPASLAGALDLTGFDGLSFIFIFNTAIDGLTVPDLPFSAVYDNSCSVRSNMTEGEAILTGGYIGNIYLLSAAHVYCRITGEAESDLSDLPVFTADITVSGEGYAGVNAFDDEAYYVIRLCAVPKEGSTFLGWYDADGKLVSKDETFEIFGENTAGPDEINFHGEFSYTAKFE